MSKKESNVRIGPILKWVYTLSGPVLSLAAFLIGYYLDPLNFGKHQSINAIPAFLFSIIILLVTQNINNEYGLSRSTEYADKIYEAIKDYVHVTSVGSPEKAMEYVCSRIPSLREVKNTSFNIEFEIETSDEKLYDKDVYDLWSKSIAIHCGKNLVWKDIGDLHALERFRRIQGTCHIPKNRKSNYKYKLIQHNEPQINFIILEYSDDSREVMFNWDFRGLGQDPTVLVSRDSKIIEMFSVHFTHLWRSGVLDHDNNATRSTS